MNKKIMIIVSTLTIASCFFSGCSKETDKPGLDNNKPEINTDTTKDNLSLSKFIPNGNYKVSFAGSDMSNELLFITGDGTSYKTIGVNGKGYYIEEFKLIDNELCFRNKVDIENIDNIKSLEDINTLTPKDVMNGDKVVILRENPTELDSFKIVEKGKDLKLDSIQLKGDYIKVEENKPGDDGNTVIETYYSEGLGVVKYDVIFDNVVMDFSELVACEEFLD